MKRGTKGGLLLICSLFLLTSCGSSGVGKIAGVKSGPNALTGMPGVNGPVLFVKIDDTPPAHPQIGLNKADVVYIEQVEGGLTRLAAVFSNQLPPSFGIKGYRIAVNGEVLYSAVIADFAENIEGGVISDGVIG